ncbi:MAG: CRISPR-associated endonuclease Cas2 [Patescibacteria group bacterium]
MRKENKEIIKITSKEILFSLVDVGAIVAGCFSKSYKDRIEIIKYLEKRSRDRGDLTRKIAYLRKRGLVNQFTEDKITYLELTQAGKKRIDKLLLENVKITKPSVWDRKWRIVIFDIPEKDKEVRNFVRNHLYKLGFRQIQKSVFVYPFECSSEIDLICENSGGRKYIKYMIADIIEGEQDIVEFFLDQGVLNKKDIQKGELICDRKLILPK